MEIQEIRDTLDKAVKRLNKEEGVRESEFIDALETIINLCEDYIFDKCELESIYEDMAGEDI